MLWFAWWSGFVLYVLSTFVRQSRFSRGVTPVPAGHLIGGMGIGECACGEHDPTHYSTWLPVLGTTADRGPVWLALAASIVVSWHVLWFLTVPVEWAHNRRLRGVPAEEFQWNEDML